MSGSVDEKISTMATPLSVMATAVCFAIDSQTPLGVATGIIYMLPVLFALRSPHTKACLFATLAATAGIVFGMFSGRDVGALQEHILANRLMALWAVWVIYALGERFFELESVIRRTVTEKDRDSLTGMLTRDALLRILSEHIKGETESAVLFVDLDGFKSVNDELGHAVGDLVLTTAAKRLRGCLREDDLVGRVGGDEFAIFLPDIESKEDAEIVARKILAVSEAPIKIEGKTASIGASIGISLFPENGKTTSDLIHFADVAMYNIKHFGGSAYTFYQPGMTTSVREADKANTGLAGGAYGHARSL